MTGHGLPGRPSKIKDVAFTAYAVSDVPRAVAFYRDVLGLEEGERFNDRFIEFNVGSTVFAIDGDPPPGAEPGKSTGMHFEVDDIVEMHRHLLEHGVAVSDVYDFPVCFMCFAKDPDGNSFGLHQRKPRP